MRQSATGFRVLGAAWLALLAAAPAHASSWSADDARVLRAFALSAGEDALPLPDTADLDRELANGAGPGLDRAAQALALRVARLHLLGCVPAGQRAGWQGQDSDAAFDIAAALEGALASGGLRGFLDGLRPDHPGYAGLRAALAREGDPAKRARLARDMERWRWLPREPGAEHVLVNVAAFEAQLWREGKLAGTWPVIVGKPATPTPGFSAQVTGVTFNPWWHIPASIVRERGGRFPARAGYVRVNGAWRQKPGPNNALGQVKVEMANPHSVYMHDTPSKSLFARPVRAFSHGCIRTGDAIGFAATLLDGTMPRARVDALVKAGKTVTIDLPRPIPVHIAYFTAAVQADGTLAILPDIYGRDAAMARLPAPAGGCGG